MWVKSSFLAFSSINEKTNEKDGKNVEIDNIKTPVECKVNAHVKIAFGKTHVELQLSWEDLSCCLIVTSSVMLSQCHILNLEGIILSFIQFIHRLSMHMVLRGFVFQLQKISNLSVFQWQWCYEDYHHSLLILIGTQCFHGVNMGPL